MLIRSTQRGLGALALLTLMLSGCGGHSSDEPRAAPAATTGQTTVDALGGLVTGPDQVTLSIAPDSVATSTTFRIARDASQAPPLVGMTLLSPIYAVTPHGHSFDPHALLQLPYDASQVPAGAAAVVLRGEPDGSWHVQANRGTQAGVAVADVGELSWYAVGVCTPGDAGTFGFGIGDCPANHSLKLEYLDGQGGVFPVQRDERGRALPFLPMIERPTDIALRLTWTRPAGVDRVDSIQLQGPYQAVIAGKPLIGEDVNQPLTVRDAKGHIDPAQIAGASGPQGAIVRYNALAEYCWTGFIIGRGDKQRVCWRFDDDIAFRVHDVGPRPEKPIITAQPANVSVVEGSKASFHVEATGLVQGHAHVVWLRRKDANQPWALAYDATAPKPGVTLSADGQTLTLTAHQAQDNGDLFLAKVCNLSTSGAESCADNAREAQLTVTRVNAQASVDGPLDQSVPEHSTVDMLVTATGTPYATVEFWQLKNGVDTLLKTCPPARVTLQQPSGPLPPNPTACSLHLPDPSFHPADVLMADSGTQFYGKVKADTQATLTTRLATLTVTPLLVAPRITSQPQSLRSTVGGTASFSVQAEGSSALSYQWRFNGLPLSDHAAGAATSGVAGATSSTLKISNVQSTDAGAYSVEVSNGTPPDAVSDTANLSLSRVMTMAAGGGHTCASHDDGTLSCAGLNDNGQLGDGTRISRTQPTWVPGRNFNWILAAGGQHTCAQGLGGDLFCWGSNAHGQLGDGGLIDKLSPTKVAGLNDISAVTAGDSHTCVLKHDGSVWCWGANAFGQLGIGASGTGDVLVPTEVPGLKAIALGAGSGHTCAVRGDLTVACWGRNQLAQLGDGSMVDRSVPTTVPGLAGMAGVFAGLNHTCALSALGTVMCWGSNRLGQLGEGTMTADPVLTPTLVTGLSGARSGASGSFHTCVARGRGAPPLLAGYVACWGDHSNGQLGGNGDGASPNALFVNAAVSTVAAGQGHSCAVMADGSAACWGLNNHGQLGDGTTVDRHSPTPAEF